MQAKQSKVDELHTMANNLSPTELDDSETLAAAHAAAQRRRGFVTIGYQLSEGYVKELGTKPGSEGGVPRALTSHVVRVEVLLGSVTVTQRAFECGNVVMGAELQELQVCTFLGHQTHILTLTSRTC
jgi:hypothetical protein